MDTQYIFLLDLFPLIDGIVAENKVLGETLQRCGLELLFSPEQEKKDQIKILLQLSKDLGYVDEEVVAYLQKQLQKI